MIGRFVTIALVSLACVAAGARTLARPPASKLLEPTVRNGSLLALDRNDLLVWNGDGQAQLLRDASAWQPVTTLPVARVTQVRATGTNILVVGFSADQDPLALQLTAALAPQAKWALPSEWFQIGSGSGASWLVSEKGALTLAANGALGTRTPSPAPAQAKTSTGTLFGHRTPTSVILCQGEDKTLAHASPAWCASQGQATWQLEGRFQDPLVCGSYLVLRTVQSPQKTEIAVHALATGAVVAKSVVNGRPQLACLTDQQLLIGAFQLEAKSLPALEPVWQVRAKGPIAGLAVLADWIAYQKTGSDQLQLVPRPTATVGAAPK